MPETGWARLLAALLPDVVRRERVAEDAPGLFLPPQVPEHEELQVRDLRNAPRRHNASLYTITFDGTFGGLVGDAATDGEPI